MSGRNTAAVLLVSFATIAGCAPSDRPAPQAVSHLAEITVDEPLEVTPPITKADLIGVPVGELHDVLGTPALRRTEKTAQYWRYQYSGCQLDVYAFRDAAEDQARTSYVRLRPDQTTDTVNADPLCQALASTLNETPRSPKRQGLPVVFPR